MKYWNSNHEERIGYDFYFDIAKRIVEAREHKGWTQAQMAKESGLSVSKISAMETVKVRFTLPDVKKFAEILDVEVDWLIKADLDRAGKTCRYLVWSENFSEIKFYQDATSAQMAFLLVDQRLREKGIRFLDKYDRGMAKLVGVLLSDTELKTKFPKRTGPSDDELELESDRKEAPQ